MTSETDKVVVERDGSVTIVTINRPKARNAVDNETADALAMLSAMYASGADPATVVTDLMELTHFLTRAKIVPEILDSAGTPEAERTRGRVLAEGLSMPSLTRAWQMLLKGLRETQAAAPVERHAAIAVAILDQQFDPALPVRRARDRIAQQIARIIVIVHRDDLGADGQPGVKGCAIPNHLADGAIVTH